MRDIDYKIPRRFKRFREWLANLEGFFWAPCPICGELFAGYELGRRSVPAPEEGECMSWMACRWCDAPAHTDARWG